VKNITFIISVMLLLLLACKNNKNVITTNLKSDSVDIPENIITYFYEKDSVQIIPNKVNTLVLYLSVSSTSPANPTSNSKFLVFDQKLNQILIQGNYENSLIKWYDNDQLLLTRFLGIIETPASSNIRYFLIDVYSKDVNEISSEKINQQL